MVIQHNLSAQNANRQLSVVVGGLSKSMEKLSGGYKLNHSPAKAGGFCGLKSAFYD